MSEDKPLSDEINNVIVKVWLGGAGQGDASRVKVRHDLASQGKDKYHSQVRLGKEEKNDRKNI